MLGLKWILNCFTLLLLNDFFSTKLKKSADNIKACKITQHARVKEATNWKNCLLQSIEGVLFEIGFLLQILGNIFFFQMLSAEYFPRRFKG